MRMPLRFVFGIKPVDNGDSLDPSNKGELEFDQSFAIATSEAQTWLLHFCQNLKEQKFFAKSVGPLLSNCFIETFKDWMNRRCKNEFTGQNRAPCCQASKFPYTKSIFEKSHVYSPDL